MLWHGLDLFALSHNDQHAISYGELGGAAADRFKDIHVIFTLFAAVLDAEYHTAVLPSQIAQR